MRLMRSALVASCAVVALGAVDPFTPARYSAGSMPPMPLEAIGGGQVFLELTVTARGAVDETEEVVPKRTLRTVGSRGRGSDPRPLQG